MRDHPTGQSHMPHGSGDRRSSGLSGANVVLICFLAIIGFFLVLEHRAHLYGILPWLILAICPLMHLFMHRGHGHGGHNSHHDSREE